MRNVILLSIIGFCCIKLVSRTQLPNWVYQSIRSYQTALDILPHQTSHISTRTGVYNEAPVGDIYLGEILWFRFFVSNNQGDPSQRAAAFAQKLIQLKKEEADFKTIRLKSTRNKTQLIWKETLLVSLAQADAKRAGYRTVKQMGRAWLTRLRQGVVHEERVGAPKRIREERAYCYRLSPKHPLADPKIVLFHSGLKNGAKVRILNPQTGWSIVVRARQDQRYLQAGTIFLDAESANAIGFKIAGPLWVKVEEM